MSYRINTTFINEKKQTEIKVSILVADIDKINGEIFKLLGKKFFHEYNKVDINEIMEQSNEN